MKSVATPAFTVAGAAIAPSATDTSVLGIVGMPLWAVRLTGVTEALHAWPIPAQDILTARDGFDVCWVHTGAIAAKMVALKPRGDEATERFIREAVSINYLVGLYRELAIAFHARPSPHPAGTEIGAVSRKRAIWVDLRPKALRQTGIAEEGRGGKMKLHRKTSPFGAREPEVSCLAAPIYCFQYIMIYPSGSKA